MGLYSSQPFQASNNTLNNLGSFQYLNVSSPYDHISHCPVTDFQYINWGTQTNIAMTAAIITKPA